jgi:hypothetical protein
VNTEGAGVAFAVDAGVDGVTTRGVVEAVVDTGAGGKPVAGDTTRGDSETLSAAVVVDEATAGAGDGGDGTDAPPHPPTRNRPNVKPDVNVYRFTRISMTHERQGSSGLADPIMR